MSGATFTSVVDRLTDWFEELPPVSLDELLALGAARLERRDRKYVVSPDQLGEVLDRLVHATHGAASFEHGVSILEIDGRRSSGYESLYFDTPELDSYLGAARRRPNRFKVRTRTYVDDETTWIEVKLRDRRGRTVKQREEYPYAYRSELTDRGRTFAAGFPAVAPYADRLEPVLQTRYRRSTLVVGQSRVTIDRGVRCVGRSGAAVGIGEHVVVETKSGHHAGDVDRVLWSLGIRPERFSKFAVGMAALDASLPANKWQRPLERYVRAEPR